MDASNTPTGLSILSQITNTLSLFPSSENAQPTPSDTQIYEVSLYIRREIRYPMKSEGLLRMQHAIVTNETRYMLWDMNLICIHCSKGISSIYLH